MIYAAGKIPKRRSQGCNGGGPKVGCKHGGGRRHSNGFMAAEEEERAPCSTSVHGSCNAARQVLRYAVIPEPLSATIPL